MFLVPQVMVPTATADEIEALDKRIRESVASLQRLINERDRMMGNYTLRPIQLGEVI